ncbi:DUF3168 domain-containing protein [Phenylobacterium sp.]|uniref:tail completion protein gp17 n=1 Tax=Phenylobacterium sp. TaxID=1871053 RepID=UPI0025F3BA66|nr:DUF3168 domain-containing protein [Phenylobacterium sp.]MBX3482531.1 DUF3168 domain-containing protein [Phenylobacterium sp.]MCW5759245.1 DUF3168 domain-containing protein [Phenylobacterium sp.]
MKAFVETTRGGRDVDEATGTLYFRRLIEVRVWNGDEEALEESLLAFLAADAGVAGMLADRLSWDAAPQAQAFPRGVLTTISERPDYAMQGATGLNDTLVQIDLWGESWASTKGSAEAVVAALKTLAG